MVEAAIAWVRTIAPVLAQPPPPPPPPFGGSDDDEAQAPASTPVVPPPPAAFGDEVRRAPQQIAQSSILSMQRSAAWAAVAAERTDIFGTTAASRTDIRLGFMQLAKGAGTYAAAEETAMAAEQPHALAARSRKAPLTRGRILTKGHLQAGLQVVLGKLETSKYREKEDTWWEQGGHEEEEGSGEEDEHGGVVSRRGVRRGGRQGNIKVTVKQMRAEMCQLGYSVEAKEAKRWQAVKVALDAARAAPRAAPRRQKTAAAASSEASSSEDEPGDKDSENDSENDDDFDDEEFEATILDSKISQGTEIDGHRKGTILYKIAWSGYSADSATWEPRVNVGLELIQEYEESLHASAAI